MAEGSNAPGGNGARKRPGKQQPPSGASDGQCRRVVVVSDTRLLRDGVALALARCGVLHVVGSADVAEAPALVIAQRPDAVLLEAGGAGGLELPRLLRDVLPVLAKVGGSAAQREVVEETLLLCLVTSGQVDRATALLDERLDRRLSPLDASRRSSLCPAAWPSSPGVDDLPPRSGATA